MRVGKIPVFGEGDFDPARVHRAEQRFLDSLRREAGKPVQTRGRGRTVKVSRVSAGAARGRGKSLGAGFARLNGDSRAESFAAAIEDGARAAKRRDARDAALMNDPAHLESMGFTKIGKPSADDFDDDFCPDDSRWDSVLRGAKF
jgi:hypothetical protein